MTSMNNKNRTPLFQFNWIVGGLASGVLLLLLMAVLLALRQHTITSENTALPDATPYQGTEIDPPLLLNDFAMPASTGQTLHLSDFRGKWVMLFFGFTHCPDICPVTLTDYVRVIEQLGADADALQVLFISVDGARDTPAVLANYVTRFNPSFVGLQGTTETLSTIQGQFGLQYEYIPLNDGTSNYTVDHSARTYLIDPQGQLRITFSFGTETDVLLNRIRQAVQAG